MAKVKFISPAGIAVYPWLTKADDKFGDAKFKVKVKVDPKDATAVKTQIKTLFDAGKYKGNIRQTPLKEDDEGNLLISFSSKFLPTIEDARGNRLVDSFNPPEPSVLAKLRIGGGSIIKVAAEPFYYDKGMSLQLVSVRVLKLVEASGGSDFGDADDGWEAKAAEEDNGAEDASEFDGAEDLDL